MSDKQAPKDKIRQLLKEGNYTVIADLLNNEGFRTKQKKMYNAKSVSHRLLKFGIRGKRGGAGGKRGLRGPYRKTLDRRTQTPLEILTSTLTKTFPTLSQDDVAEVFGSLDRALQDHPHLGAVELEDEIRGLLFAEGGKTEEMENTLRAIVDMDAPLELKKLFLRQALGE